MLDATAKERITVEGGGKGNPVIWLPDAGIPAMQELLDSHRVKYYVGEIMVSLNEEPDVGYIMLGYDTDTDAVQRLLDSLP